MNTYDKWQQAVNSDVPDWNTEEMWSRIEQHLPPQRKRKRFVGFLLWGGGLLLSLGIFAHQRCFPEMTSHRSNMIDVPLLSYSQQPELKRKHPFGVADFAASNADPVQVAKENLTVLFQSKKGPKAAQNIMDETVVKVSGLPRVTEALEKIMPDSVWNSRRTVLTLSAVVPHSTLYSTSEEIQPVFPRIKQEPPSATKAHHRWEVSFGSSFMTSYSPVKADRQETKTYAAAIQQSTTPLETVSVDGTVLYAINSSIGVLSGIQWQRSAFWFRHTDVKTVTDQMASDSAVFFNINGVNYYGSGVLTRDRITTTRMEAPAVLHQWFVPIMAYYQRRYTRLVVRVSGGVLFNVFSKYNGYTLDRQMQPTRSQQRISTVYRPGGAHGVSLGCTVQHTLGGRWSIYAGGRSQYALGSVLQRNTGVRQHPLRGGVSIGIIYRPCNSD